MQENFFGRFCANSYSEKIYRSLAFCDNVIVKKSHMILAAIIATLNILFFNNLSISLIVVSCEIAVLVYYFLQNDITKYLGCYLVFLCLSLEFDALVGSSAFYGFKNFRVLGINLGIVCLLPVLVLTVFKKINMMKIKIGFPHVYKFFSIMIFMSCSGIICGLVMILIDDNNIQSMDGMFSSFIGECYNMSILPLLLIIVVAYILTWETDKINELKSYLIAILVGVVFSMILSVVKGIYGSYGGVDTLLVTNVIRYVPFMVLLPFYKNYKSVKSIMIFALIGVSLSLMYNATGKTIIVYMLLPVAVCVILWKRKKLSPQLFGVLLLLPVVVLFAMKATEILEINSMLFKAKLNQSMSLLNIFEPNWLINMPSSPQARIIELMNIIYEYLEKPWMFLFGKGYMGTVKDHIGMLSATFLQGGYSNAEWDNGTFYGVHETLNSLFLYHGLFGMGFYLYMLKGVFTSFSKSPWILIGGFWFLIIYGFSVTMSAFGIVALLLGYSELDIIKINNCFGTNTVEYKGNCTI